MKKLLILAMVILINSASAITLAEIDLGTHPRAYAVQVQVVDDLQVALKFNNVTYPYWTASYPYDGLKYSGEITDWIYTHDLVNFFSYTPYWDDFNFINHTVFVNMSGYSTGSVTIYATIAGQRTELNPQPQLIYSSGSTWFFQHSAQGVTSYFIETTIVAEDGTAKLGNNVSLSQ